MTRQQQAMLGEVRRTLAADDGATKLGGIRFPFRNRYEHTLRVTRWAERLLATDGRGADGDAVLIAAIWHDAGYAVPGEEPHAIRSAALFRERAPAYGIEGVRKEQIAELIAQHSHKERISTAPLELTLLMEADDLDETGAMGALWDAMGEGAKPVQSYRAAAERIAEHAVRFQENAGHFITSEARRLYDEKRALLTELIRQARRDLEEYGQD